jgi:DNA-binding transcriptional LysR family regulator
MRNLDTTALRSFVAVSDAGGVTRAAGFLNLTQSAVSMQIKRLEETLDQKLLERSGRGVALTPAGAQLLTYAQRIVALNDEAFDRLTDQAWEGEIVLGVPSDIVYPAIPRVLQQMERSHPRVRVRLISSTTRALRQAFGRGEVDVILTTESERGPGGETLVSVPLRWIGAPDGSAWRGRPVRLAFARDCIFRENVVERLDAAGIAWELTVDSDNDRTIEATVSADLAVTTSLDGHAPPQLSYIETGGALPDLQIQQINLYRGAARGPVIDALTDAVRQGFGADRAAAQAVV